MTRFAGSLFKVHASRHSQLKAERHAIFACDQNAGDSSLAVHLEQVLLPEFTLPDGYSITWVLHVVEIVQDLRRSLRAGNEFEAAT